MRTLSPPWTMGTTLIGLLVYLLAGNRVCKHSAAGHKLVV